MIAPPLPSPAIAARRWRSRWRMCNMAATRAAPPVSTQSNGGELPAPSGAPPDGTAATVICCCVHWTAMKRMPDKKSGPNGKITSVTRAVCTGRGNAAARFPQLVRASAASIPARANCAMKNNVHMPGMMRRSSCQFKTIHMYSWKSPDITKAKSPPTCLAFLANGAKKVRFINLWITKFQRRPQKSRTEEDRRRGISKGSSVAMPTNDKGNRCINMAEHSKQYT
mmetsp:Transcript_59676/g.182262  ORF Transcript_59676/g.182262 Transcript_59676/m.182262 type:complete len:225 (-) Transcript_59676:530-1204(-)